MISSGQELTEVENLQAQHGALFTRMQNASVKLSGGVFTGSGALLATTVAGPDVYLAVITAAHNLYVYINGLSGNVKQGFWDGKLAECETDEPNPAQARLDLLNQKKDAIFTQARTGNIAPMQMEFPGAGLPSVSVSRIVMGEWTRDVCLLLAKRTAGPNYAGAAVYQAGADLAAWTEVYGQLSTQKTLPQGYRLIQAGFGQTQPGNEESKRFQFKVSRVARVNGGWQGTYFDSNLGENTEVLKLDSRHDWTTLEGDSGGPLFAAHPGSGKLAVLGVTLGSDVFAREQDETEALQRDGRDGAHNNACTTLESLHAAWPTSTKASFANALFGRSFEF